MTATSTPLDTWQRHVPDGIRRPTIVGLAIVAAWIIGFGLWAAMAPLDGAVVAAGSFVATGQNKQVQHLEGGIIRQMLVREGDLVQSGQTLVRLDDTPAKSKLRRLVLREYRLLTMQARLEAQIDLKEDFELPKSLAAGAKDPEVAQIFARQKMELKARRQNQAATRIVSLPSTAKHLSTSTRNAVGSCGMAHAGTARKIRFASISEPRTRPRASTTRQRSTTAVTCRTTLIDLGARVRSRTC